MSKHPSTRTVRLGPAAVAAQKDSPKPEPYLGLLYPIEDLRVYGYLSTSKVKLIAVLDDEEVKDAEMRAVRALDAPPAPPPPGPPHRALSELGALMPQFFRRLHGLYVDTVSNPFHQPERCGSRAPPANEYELRSPPPPLPLPPPSLPAYSIHGTRDPTRGLLPDHPPRPAALPRSELATCSKFQRQVDRLVDAGLF